MIHVSHSILLGSKHKKYVQSVFMTLRSEIFLEICGMLQLNKVFVVCYRGNLGLWSFVSRTLQNLSAFYYPYVAYTVGFMVLLQWYFVVLSLELWCCCGGFNHGLCTWNLCIAHHIMQTSRLRWHATWMAGWNAI